MQQGDTGEVVECRVVRGKTFVLVRYGGDDEGEVSSSW